MNKRLLTAMLVSSFASVSFAAQGPNSESMNPNGTTGTSTRGSTTTHPTPRSSTTDTQSSTGSSDSRGTAATPGSSTDTRSSASSRTGNTSMDEHGQRDTTQPNQGQQQSALSDANLQRSIHEQIMNDDSLSMRARGVTVTSENGKVTLTGSVASSEERSRLEEIAKSAKGTTSVDNKTEVESF